MPFQRSFAVSQVSAKDESIQASTRSQSMGPLRPPCLKNQSCTFQASRRFSCRGAHAKTVKLGGRVPCPSQTLKRRQQPSGRRLRPQPCPHTRGGVSHNSSTVGVRRTR